MKKRLFSGLLAVLMLFVCSTSALAVSPTASAAEETPEIDADVAATIAMMFVWANIGDSAWSETTDIDSIIPLYD